MGVNEERGNRKLQENPNVWRWSTENWPRAHGGVGALPMSLLALQQAPGEEGGAVPSAVISSS